jgi:hypothetical protein
MADHFENTLSHRGIVGVRMLLWSAERGRGTTPPSDAQSNGVAEGTTLAVAPDAQLASIKA